MIMKLHFLLKENSQFTNYTKDINQTRFDELNLGGLFVTNSAYKILTRKFEFKSNNTLLF